MPISGKSHWVYGQNFVDALLDRGHEVTCITSNTYIGSKPNNYTEVLVDPPFNYATSMGKHYFTFDECIKRKLLLDLLLCCVIGSSSSSTLWKSLFQTVLGTITMFPVFSNLSSDYALRNDKVQEFIHNKNLTFDLVINHEVYHDSFLMFSHQYKAPLVTICKYEHVFLRKIVGFS